MNGSAADVHKDLDAPIWARSVLTLDIDAHAMAPGDCLRHRISLMPADCWNGAMTSSSSGSRRSPQRRSLGPGFAGPPQAPVGQGLRADEVEARWATVDPGRLQPRRRGDFMCAPVDLL